MAALARRTRSLTTSGAAAAALLGALAVAAGWPWAILLVVYFVAASLLSRAGATRKARRTASIIDKGGARDWVQVLVNGGVFGGAALGSLLAPHPLWQAVGTGALAAASADTWATEIGTWLGGTPRSAWNWKRVAPGTSGGMTDAGTAGMFGGALLIALVARALGWSPGAAWGALGAGIAGAVADTVIGARFQERRRCTGCGEYTERIVHTCGSRTRRSRGIPGLDNDMVNLIATLLGGGVALKVAELVGT